MSDSPPLTWIAAFFAVVILGQFVWIASLTFRNSYLRQKLVIRVDKSEMEQINKTDLDFWSFLK